jgi:hypothetical protein
VQPVLDLPGVGRNLHDQPCLERTVRELMSFSSAELG